MTTKGDRLPQDSEKQPPHRLTDRQAKALPFIITSPTYTEACRKAKVDRKTFYRWLDDSVFKAELERQQQAVSDRALGMLAQNVTQAIERLAGLVNDSDKRLARLASKDMLELHQRYLELKDIDARLKAIEQRLPSGS
ncbi:MAG: hypothetical protein IH892_02085 [Planctomycetes bacterium]|nr:hypothetical protein [Planctomycetota bacterium]